MLIGIDESNGLVYESRHGHGGRLLWPSPIVTPAIFFEADSRSIKTPSRGSGFDVQFYFREDFFDPVSRIRRGRLYKKMSGGGQPKEWFVVPNPAVETRANVLANVPDGVKKRLLSYGAYFLSIDKGINAISSILLALGAGEAYSLWSIIGVERISSDEEVITLKARQSLGILPEVNWEKVPETFRAKVQETLETLLDDVHRAGPESVVDRCRDAASAILCAHLGEAHKKKDLGPLIRELNNEETKKNIVIAASDIVRIFHVRAKPNEQITRGLRAVREQDAELAVQCVGVILCELGWGEWR